MQNADEIVKGLWLGDMFAATDKKFYTKNGITDVINCTPDVPFIDLNIRKYSIAVDDVAEPVHIAKMTEALPRAVRLIALRMSEGARFLVHCAAGRQRSAIVVLTFLYYFLPETQFNTERSMKYLQKRRPVALATHVTFKDAYNHVISKYTKM